jgi:murein DD-endopeptidase MepM/ murein hydrolase activator NlpD
MSSDRSSKESRWTEACLRALWAFCSILLLGPAIPAVAQESYTSVFRGGTDAYQFVDRQEWSDFVSTWTTLSGQDLRLDDIETYLDGATRYYSATFRAGTDGYALWDLDPASFDTQLASYAATLRLVDFERYELSNGSPRYVGVWREGTDAYAFEVELTWTDFVTAWTNHAAAGLRLIDIETWRNSSGALRYAGIFRAGTGGYLLLRDMTRSDLISEWETRAAENLRLIDMEEYTDNAGEERYVGVWREGTDDYGLWLGVDNENLLSRIHSWDVDSDLRLEDFDVCPGCEALCANQVVSNTSYVYPVTGDTTYRWPVDSDAEGNWLRHSAISNFSETPNWVLPFGNPSVIRGGTWLYSAGNWHHAIDFQFPTFDSSFNIRASAAGKVLAIGWDNWSGNYVTVSHDVAGQVDAFRTIYMHMRNGADNDCANAWNISVPWLDANDPANSTLYKQHLNASGCTSDPASRSLDSSEWGVNSAVIQVNVNDAVTEGQILGRAGNTGPGGKRDTTLPHPNTHLHIFYARKDPTDGLWYFVDPYGIYGPGWSSGCYPDNVWDPITGPCARYPNLWKGGQPQFAAPEPGFAVGLIGGCLALTGMSRRRRRHEK